MYIAFYEHYFEWGYTLNSAYDNLVATLKGDDIDYRVEEIEFYSTKRIQVSIETVIKEI